MKIPILLASLLLSGCSLSRSKAPVTKMEALPSYKPNPIVEFLCGAEIKSMSLSDKSIVRKALVDTATRPAAELEMERYRLSSSTSTALPLPEVLATQFIPHGAMNGQGCCTENKKFWINVQSENVKIVARKMVVAMDRGQDKVLLHCGPETLGEGFGLNQNRIGK